MKAIIGINMLVAAIILMIIWILNGISSARIDSWLERAKDAGNPAQVAEFLTNYKKALDDAGRIDKKYSSVFRYPGTYMPVYIRAVDGLIQRAEDLSVQNPTDTSYQMGLVNLEKDLGDIETAAYGVWFAYTGVWVCWICVVLFCTFWIPLAFE